MDDVLLLGQKLSLFLKGPGNWIRKTFLREISFYLEKSFAPHRSPGKKVCPPPPSTLTNVLPPLQQENNIYDETKNINIYSQKMSKIDMVTQKRSGFLFQKTARFSIALVKFIKVCVKFFKGFICPVFQNIFKSLPKLLITFFKCLVKFFYQGFQNFVKFSVKGLVKFFKICVKFFKGFM